MKEQVIKVLEDISLLLRRDGGDVKFVDLDDNGVVKVRLLGACGDCPYAEQTLKSIVERRLKYEIPEITEVISV